MLHHKQALKLLVEFECNGHYNQKSGCGERIDKVHIADYACRLQCLEKHRGNDCDNHKEERTEEGQTLGYLAKVFCCLLARADSLNGAAVLLKVACNFVGLELNCRIEETKQHNKHAEKHEVCNTACAQPFGPPAVEGGGVTKACAVCKESCDHLRHSKNCRRENDGQNAVCVNFDGNTAALSAVLLATLNLLCVVYNDFAFCQINEHDKEEDKDYEYEEDKQSPECKVCSFAALEDLFDRACDCKTCGRNDTYEDNKADTVTYAKLGDSVAKPHGNHRTRNEHCRYEDCDPRLAVAGRKHRACNTAALCPADCNTRCLCNSKDKGCNLGYECNLFSACLALTSPTLKGGNGYRKQLHYN